MTKGKNHGTGFRPYTYLADELSIFKSMLLCQLFVVNKDVSAHLRLLKKI